MRRKSLGTRGARVRHEYGTVWTLRRSARIARCALRSWPAGTLELRILVDDHLLLTDHRACIDEAFSLADEWKRRMLEQGWRPVIPARDGTAAAETDAVPQPPGA